MRSIHIPVALCVLLLPQFAFAQMEKRKDSLYHLHAFVSASPTIGEAAPELKVKTIDGEPVALSDYLGTNLIVIKGSYT